MTKGQKLYMNILKNIKKN